MKKISKVEELTIDQLKEALKVIITHEGFINIEDSGNVITAVLDNPMSPILNMFILFPFQLSGEVDIDSIRETITKEQTQKSANVVTLVSKNHISKGFQDEISNHIPSLKVNYIGRDKFIELIDKDYPDFWKHDDIFLLQYEKDFSDNVKQEDQLRRLKLPTEKCEKLLSIYINPQLLTYEEDKKTHVPIRRRVDLNSLLEEKKPIILSGDSGSGKTSLLKHLGGLLIEQNAEQRTRKNLPIYIIALDLLKHEFDLKKVLSAKIDTYFPDADFDIISKEYDVNLFIDSIDEFDSETQKAILHQLQCLYQNNSVKFYIGTREPERIEKSITNKEALSCEISKFNYEQIRRFVSAFFSGDEFKTNNLLDALRENKIIERLPITPLTLSLISILYDENDFEIPATITDIYDNFNDLIIGKAVVSSKIEFIDISFKERILSLYALLLMETKNHKPLTIEEFKVHFEQYFEGKTLPIKEAQLEDVLLYLIHNTGILYIKDEQWVAFTHDSYMEYYAAIEIFKYERTEKENNLVENFFDIHWQNVAIFYAGKTKDMPVFAEKINKKLQASNRWYEYISGIQGSGYLLQALYQTDNKIRRDLVLTALDLVLESNNILKKMASDDSPLFKNYRMPILQLMNFIHFYEMFNSITLKDPLLLSYNLLKTKFDKVCSSNDSDKALIPILGYKLLELAFTLDSKRINESHVLEEVVMHTNILKDSTLNIIAQFTLDFMGKTGYKEMREDLRKKYHSLASPQKALIENSASKVRFSVLDTITVERKVKIFVEGKTDARILEHAFMVLTNGQTPYWKIEIASVNGQSGSSTIVTKVLDAAYAYSQDYTTIIGIYDHDDAGLAGYRGLNKIYEEKIKDTVKKHANAEVFAIALPIPGEMKQYLQEKQAFNFFEIEHYFGHDYLERHHMLSSTSIPDIYEIGSKKNDFSNDICKEWDPYLFRYFLDLFKLIDQLTNIQIDYII